ncbi:HAD-IC family P-type ATPase [Litoribacter ruber]|uniref:cation-translocating P-type ATPase n=1 Tax=Litoribacter ruber TaxID=702568 RepID=UPI001BD9586F|nr:HAD-IC family P-type ATPase [Litoribacter ruber]MBT0810841.1 HAD-IC family P-type ATPase [Litoribacter ruber]
MNWHALSTDEALGKLNSGVTGLRETEIQDRRTRYGFNEIPEPAAKHWVWILLKQFQSLLILILFIAATIAFLTDHQADFYIILAVIFINTTIGFIQEYKAEKAVASLRSYIEIKSKVIREGQTIQIPARDLVPGDIIILEEGDHIPADGRLIEAKNIRAIEAPLTGESVPVNKSTDQLPEGKVLADRSNMVYKGTFIAGGFALAMVTSTGLSTALGEIAQSLDTIKVAKTNFQKKTDVLAKQMAFIAIISALLLFTVAYFVQKAPLEETLLIAIAALVSSIPEGLPAVLSIVLAIGANRMAKRKAIIREFTATETLGAVTTIITDKTGTLTQNTLTVRKLSVPGEYEWNVSGEGWMPVGNFTFKDKICDLDETPMMKLLFKICTWSNNSSIQHDNETDRYQLVGDPTEGALLVLARKGGYSPLTSDFIAKLDDMPFNSTIKMRASLIDEMGKRQILVVGAPEQVLYKSLKCLRDNGEIRLDSVEKARVRKKIDQWSSNSMRVIALAYKDVDTDTSKLEEEDINNLVFAGLVGMIDPPRPDVKDAVQKSKQAGIRVVMATGDHINTAISIAKATGIIEEEDNREPLALTETQLLNLDEKEFEHAIQHVDVFARLTPNMKLKIATALQKKGELIAMTGDGVNDAPALKKADVGVAMGIMGTDVARDSAKVILADDNFSTIIKAVEEGRIVFNNTRHTSFFLLTTNFAEIATLLTAVLLGMPVPLTATQILWLNLVTDGTCTTAMATEKGHGHELRSKPVNPKEKILNKTVVPFLFINAALMTVLALGAFNYFLPEGLQKARSAAFLIMAFCQLFNVFNMRTLSLSIFKIGLFSNKYVNIALIVSLVIQILIIEVPFFEDLFQFDPISFSELMVLGLLSSSVLWFGEAYKFIRDKFNLK